MRYSNVAPGRPYHAAYVPIRADDVGLHRHHDFSEMFYIKSGIGQHRLPLRSDELAPGDLVLVWQHHQHGFASTTSKPLELINVAFPTDLLNSFLRLAELEAMLSDTPAPIPLRVRLTGHESQVAAEAFDRILTRFDGASTSLDLMRFWVDTLPLLGTDQGMVEAERPPWLTQMCLAMEKEENVRAGLPRMLELASVSHGHLARSMGRYCGTTPIDFLTGLRIRYATRLLRQTDQPIAEISTKCGFTSPSYFSKQFRRTQGTSPRSFREQARAAVVPHGFTLQ